MSIDQDEGREVIFMSGSTYPLEKLTERYTHPITSRRFLVALDVVSGGDAPDFGWFTFLSVCEAATNVLCPGRTIYAAIHRQKLEHAAPVTSAKHTI